MILKTVLYSNGKFYSGFFLKKLSVWQLTHIRKVGKLLKQWKKNFLKKLKSNIKAEGHSQEFRTEKNLRKTGKSFCYHWCLFNSKDPWWGQLQFLQQQHLCAHRSAVGPEDQLGQCLSIETVLHLIQFRNGTSVVLRPEGACNKATWPSITSTSSAIPTSLR